MTSGWSAYDTLIVRQLRQHLTDRVADLSASLADGRAQSFEDYRYRTGQIRALRETLVELEAIRKRALGGPEDK